MLCFLGILLAGGPQPLPAQRLQPGYIVSHMGDTTRGFVQPGNPFRNQRQIRFLDRYGVKAIYTPARLKAYGYGEKAYVALPTPFYYSGFLSDTVIFILRRIEGPASLYRFYARRSVFTLQRGPAYFELVEMPDGSLHEVSLTFKWRRIAEAFNTYPELADAIRNGLYKPEDMGEIVETFNTWFRQQAERE
ncbi:MAG: hypothetical protein D6722_00465 [Bacteroidetes bacterium]|nr:MAG: hypothetical protein D6722_00465 [Bacteroidota bacterium]